jgi:hypothetical protein
MKYVKMLGLAAVAAAALMAFVGAGTASATTLTGEGGAILKSGTTIHAIFEATEKVPKATLTTSFKNIECAKSTVQGKTTNETGTAVTGSVSTLTFEECNCEVKVLKTGTLSITWTEKTNGTLTSSGAEVTASCSTIFGNVHCIYATSATHLGTLTGGTTATMDIESAGIPRLTTNSLCDTEANWDAHYKVDIPDTLNVIN